MGGRDKLVLDVGGHRLLDRVLRAARPLCDPLAVVGPARPTSVRAVRFLQEDHPGGGPVPAVFAALAAVGQSEVALVMAGDLPLVTSRSLSRLLYALDSAPQAHAAAALDERGLPNPLLAAYRLDALRRASARGLDDGEADADLKPASVFPARPKWAAAAAACSDDSDHRVP
jgi:molybdopterin-guanine dinucleotide biosynthesis protein A